VFVSNKTKGPKQTSLNHLRSHMSEGGGSGPKQNSLNHLRSLMSEGGGSGPKQNSLSTLVLIIMTICTSLFVILS
jgi:hypothetical protein